MGNRRERRARRQRLRNLKNRKIGRPRIIEGADFINSMPDEIEEGADFIKSMPDEILHKIDEGADFINSMPDDILHHILSFIPTELAMKTCVLSKRWRHVWCETPSLNIDEYTIHEPGKIKQNLLNSYTAPKITSFKLRIDLDNSGAEADRWLEFAASRNVQELHVGIFDNLTSMTYDLRDFFYRSSSVKNLTVTRFCMKPRCTVSWKSLTTLSLHYCKLGDKSMDNILSGCPILESLTLYNCRLLERLDLSKSPTLRRLRIAQSTIRDSGPIVIVAPHIQYLRFTTSKKPSTLVDVSSLTEANLDIYMGMKETRLFQSMAIGMLAKSRNVERLTVGPSFLEILSLAELRGAAFPTLKVQTLIIKMTTFVRSLIPGIARLLRSSPGLKKLIVGTMKPTQYSEKREDMYLERNSDSQGLNQHHLWRSEYEVFPTSNKEICTMLGCNDATSKLLVSFMELVLRNTKTLQMMALWLGGIYLDDDAQWFEELLRMVGTLSHDNSVSIVLKQNNYFID